jgi:hypothetical protein
MVHFADNKGEDEKEARAEVTKESAAGDTET